MSESKEHKRRYNLRLEFIAVYALLEVAQVEEQAPCLG